MIFHKFLILLPKSIPKLSVNNVLSLLFGEGWGVGGKRLSVQNGFNIFYPLTPYKPTYYKIHSHFLSRLRQKRYPLHLYQTYLMEIQILLPSSISHTLGHLFCCSCCQYGDSKQTPLGPFGPKPWGHCQHLSHSSTVSKLGWSPTLCMQSGLLSDGQMD